MRPMRPTKPGRRRQPATTLAALAAVLGGTSLGVLVRDHAWVAGILISAAWVGGTAYGFRLIRRAERAGGACSIRTSEGT